MLKLEDENGTPVQRRTADYSPRRSWRTWLIGRPLPDCRRRTPDGQQGRRVGRVCLRRPVIDGLCDPGNARRPVRGRRWRRCIYAFPISIAIVILLAIVTLSYEQTIQAYPGGGGAYIVARDNLGELAGHDRRRGAADRLHPDGGGLDLVRCGAVVSAFPALFTYRVHIGIALVLFVMLVNLRGVHEVGRCLRRSDLFLPCHDGGHGWNRVGPLFTGTLGTVVDPPPPHMVETTAAVAPLPDPARLLQRHHRPDRRRGHLERHHRLQRAPKSHNAGITLLWMSGILGVAARCDHLPRPSRSAPSRPRQRPSSRSSARTAYDGRGLLYLLLIAATTVILIMAANTSFADFPRLSALLAADGFLPRQFAYRGSRLVYSRGIVTLALIASLLILVFQASVTALIPLYAIGVFLSFTLSQAGMARRWWKIGHMEPGEEFARAGLGAALRGELEASSMLINGFGALCTLGRDHRLRRDEVSGRRLGGADPDPHPGADLHRHPPPLSTPRPRPVLETLRAAAAGDTAPGDPAHQRRAPRAPWRPCAMPGSFRRM